MNKIRNFSIIAHIDHGKSTLADRMLELTGTIEKRDMREQVLDSMELERERGITIKMQPVRMIYHPNRRLNADSTQNHAEKEFLYEELTYKIRGILFEVRKNVGLGHKEQVYHNALEIEFSKAGLKFESKKNIPIIYGENKIGTYQPDFVLEDRIIIELKALPEIARPQTEQLWSYLKGCSYKLALLVNFGSKDLEIKRVVYDTARDSLQRNSASSQRDSAQIKDEYILNLIDTPGHIDFSYEVSRALRAVEGSILLVDATQGVQAQTLTTLGMAESARLKIIPVISKIDSPLARIEEVRDEIIGLLKVKKEDILLISGKTGEGVEELLDAIVERVPPPNQGQTLNTHSQGLTFRALVFDFKYSNHRGVIVFVRVFGGSVKQGDKLRFKVADKEFQSLEVGIFTPEEKKVSELGAGEIGYIVTGIKEPGVASVGDTVASVTDSGAALAGYQKPRPVVWASIYPESQDDFTLLRQSLLKLSLSDSAFSFEEESSSVLGRGFRAGFLGMLHLEIITERLRREFNLPLVITLPSITYRIIYKDGSEGNIYTPSFFPEDHLINSVWEPWVKATVIVPPEFISPVIQLLYEFEAELGEAEDFGEVRTSLAFEMPLRELMRGFFDKLKSATSGFGSISYSISGERLADVTRLDILITDEVVPAFAKVISRKQVEIESESDVEKLATVLPRQMFTLKIQAKALGRIIASRTLSGMKKDVTQHMYGGDITRKMKLREKQKKGKKKMKERGKVNIPQDVFLKMIRRG